jgi:VWFA-related protein
MRLKVCSAFLLLLSAVAQAQMGEKITVSYVEIPVTVIDRAGAPIRGLKAENFEIVDEGKLRSVNSLDTVDFSSAESIKATSPLNPVARRNFLVVFDLSFSAPFTLVRAQTAARNFVASMVHPRDRVGVATVDVEHGFRLLSAFTTDRRLVEAAIADPKSFHGSDPLQVAGESLLTTPDDMKPAQMDGGTKDAFLDDFKDIKRGIARGEDEYGRQKIDRQVGMLAGLATTLRAVSGQKHIVFLSEGFDPRLIQGRDAHGSQEQTDEGAAAEGGELWKIDSDNRYGSSGSMTLLSKLTEAARRADVVLDAVDISGLRSNSSARSGNVVVSNEGLHLLANATGGKVIKNSNDLSADFARELKMQEVVYVLGFQAPTTQPGKFHPIKVRLVNVPGGHLSYRDGYYEAGAANEVERTLSNGEILLNDIPQDGIHLAALAAPFATSGGNAQLPVILEIDGSDLIAAARGNHATTDIFIYAFDTEGLIRDALYQRIQLDLSKVGDKLRDGGLKYYATLSLPAGAYAIKSLVQVHEGAKTGFSRNDVVVPASTDVAVSQPFFFENSAKWLMIKGGSHDKTNAVYPFQVNGESFIPSAAVHLGTAQPRKFALFVQNASPDELSVETVPKTKILSLLKSKEGSKLVMEISPGSEKASSLEVVVRKKGASDQRTATIPLLN